MAAHETYHLDCLFNCGQKFSSLEPLYEHIEIDHREDDTISPFMVEDDSTGSVDIANAGGEVRHDTWGRQPRGTHHRAGAHSSRASAPVEDPHTLDDRNDPQYASFVECPKPDCREPILLSELNEHLDLHEVEHSSIYDEPSLSSRFESQASRSRIDDCSPPSLELSSLPALPSSASTRFHSELDPASRNTMDHSTNDHGHGQSRAHIARGFLSKLSDKSKPGKRISEKSQTSAGKSGSLGKAQLGPYANEDQMPSWMYKRLQAGPKCVQTRKLSRAGGLVTHEAVEGQTNGVLPILKRLIEIDEDVYKAYLCHPSVTQIGKTRWESGFCGFRNSQMLISYMQNSKHPAQTLFSNRIPGVLDIQDWIEDGWDAGINAFTREEFGRLRGTRKWIGTLEVDTFLRHFGIEHQVHQFHDTDRVFADKSLLDWVEAYFKEASLHDGKKVKCTLRPPIYFQQPGHSLTIVGIELLKDHSRNLLVLDPMFAVPRGMQQLIEQGDPRRIASTNRRLMRCYRRSQRRLSHYADFEAITLEGDLPLFPAWDVGRS